MKRSLLSILFIAGNAMMSNINAQTYQAFDISYTDTSDTTFGFNADVIANGGSGRVSPTSSATADVDGGGWYFYSTDWGTINYYNGADNFPIYAPGLPVNGIINSVATSGLTFKLASYGTNNSGRISATNAPRQFKLASPLALSNLYLLSVGGGGSATATVVITFDDNTTQTISNVAISDWYGGSNYAIKGIGRVNTSYSIATSINDPRLYQQSLSIDAENQSKKVVSFAVTKTAGSGIINVFAASGALSSALACSSLTSPANNATEVDNISVSLNWTTSTGADSYDIYMDKKADPTTLVSNVTSTNYTASNLDPSSTYYWKIVPKIGTATGVGCNINSFSTKTLYKALDITGFNVDVIANGGSAVTTTGAAPLPATTATADAESYSGTSGYYFYSADWNSGIYYNYYSGDYPKYSPGLPADGVINSITTGGLSFKLAPYTGNNDGRIKDQNVSITFPLTAPIALSELYLLTVGGGGAGTVTVDLTFEDSTTQSFTNVAIPDWYGNGDVAIAGVGRVNSSKNFETNMTKPRLYQQDLVIDAANQSKKITSFKVTKTDASRNSTNSAGSVINIFAASGKISENSGNLLVSDASKNNNIKVYPNPVKDILNFSREIKSANIYSIEGRFVKTSISGKSANLSGLAKGTYILSGTDANGNKVSEKIIKE